MLKLCDKLSIAITANVIARFVYEGHPIELRCVADDYILRHMDEHKSFYELDVLEFLRKQLANARRTVAIDVGAFIGTHSVYFAKFLEMTVIAFEANPHTFPIFVHNLKANGVESDVTPILLALGGADGRATLHIPDKDNEGTTQVSYGAGPVPVATLDSQISGNNPVSLIKIDVEGAEIEVLRGAQKTIAAHKPLVCIEAHTAAHLRQVLALLPGYSIVTCLGYSPTYILEYRASAPGFSNALWLLRAAAWSIAFRLSRGARRLFPRSAKRSKATASRYP